MDAHHEINRRNTVVKRAIVVALSVILALVVTAPIASGQSSSQSQNLGQLTGDWWNWMVSTDPSPGDGDYTSLDPRCDGEYVEGVFFLATGGGSAVERTCNVPRHMPILFSPFNYLCSAAFDPIQPGREDQPPYDTKCAKPFTSDTIDHPSKFYARVDGKDAKQQRIASGIFQWTIPDDALGLDGLVAGTYPAAQDGLWVYLKNGLNTGNHTVVFGGHFEDTPLNDPPGSSFEGTKVTYKLKAR
jgi:hypothetical protein